MLTVVTGPPCSGKTTYVTQHRCEGDIVIDYDNLAQALGSPVRHGHGDAVGQVTRAAREAAIRVAVDQHRYAGARVWIVDTKPPKHRRQQYHRASAQWVRLDVDRAELHRRASIERPELWHQLIDDWFLPAAEEC